jgi:hypothetical protein
MSVRLDIDFTKVKDELTKLAFRKLSDTGMEVIHNTLRLYSMSKRERQSNKDRGWTVDPDAGMLNDMVTDAVDSALLSAEAKLFLEQYIEDNYKDYLKKAADDAMAAAARKQAFQSIKG